MGIQVSECIWGERIADSPMFESALQHAQCALHGRYDQFQTYIDPNVDHQQIIRYHQGPQHLSGSEKQCVRQRLRLSPLRRMLLPDITPSQRRPGRNGLSYLGDILYNNDFMLIAILRKELLQMLAFLRRSDCSSNCIAFLEKRAYNPDGDEAIRTTDQDL